MNLIVAVDENWGIGNKGGLLVHVPKDMQYFKDKTLNKVVIMGRKTVQSLPHGKPLPNRTTLVLSQDEQYNQEGILKFSSLQALESALKNYNDDDVFVCGGERVYKDLLSQCKIAYVTKFDGAYEADTFFPNLDALDNWVLAEQGEKQQQNGVTFQFCVYKNKSK